MPERPFSRPNSPSVRIVPRVVRLDRMSLTAENLVAESTIEVAERQRRWLRRGCWVGCALALAAVVVVMSFPLFARWQLRRHGWELDTPFSGRTGGAGGNVPQWVDPWFGRIAAAHLKHGSLRTSDIALLRQFPKVGWITLESTDVSESTLETISQLPNLWAVDFDAVNLEPAALRHLNNSPKLDALNFFKTNLDDTAMEHIANCRHLTGLRLIDVRITDEGLLKLKPCVTLRAVLVEKTAVTSAGAAELGKSLPTLNVSIVTVHGPWR